MRINIKPLNNNRTELYQWDTDRQIEIAPDDGIAVDEIHYATVMIREALVVLPHVVDGTYVADIPNILLQSANTIHIYVVTHTANGERTIDDTTLGVTRRKKPSDYIYTETEVVRYDNLENRIKELGEKISTDYVTSEELDNKGYLTQHQDLSGYAKKDEIPTKLPASDVYEWAKQPKKPTYTADEVGAEDEGTAYTKVSEHNVDNTSHNDIRLLLKGITERLNDFAVSWNDLKDKPFYEEIIEAESIIILPETEFTGSGGEYTAEDVHIELELDTEYIVTLNGTEYVTIARQIEDFLFLGNLAEAGYGDTGEPFIFATSRAEAGAFLVYLDETDDTTMIISIRCGDDTQTVVHKISEKFLPDVEWKPTKFEKYIGNEQILKTGAKVSGITMDIMNEIYLQTSKMPIYCDGKKYEANIFYGSVCIIGNLSIISQQNPNTGEPFFIYVLDSTAYITFKDDSEHSIQLCKYSYTRLPREYSSVIIYNLSDITDNMEDISNYLLEGNQVRYRKSKNVIYALNEDGMYPLVGYVDYKGYHVVSKHLAEDNEIYGEIVTPFMRSDDSEKIKDGQWVKVKKVGFDDTVVLEPTDSWVIESSTEGSTKKFRVTVDDSGTIHTTEVTN